MGCSGPTFVAFDHDSLGPHGLCSAPILATFQKPIWSFGSTFRRSKGYLSASESVPGSHSVGDVKPVQGHPLSFPVSSTSKRIGGFMGPQGRPLCLLERPRGLLTVSAS